MHQVVRAFLAGLVLAFFSSSVLALTAGTWYTGSHIFLGAATTPAESCKLVAEYYVAKNNGNAANFVGPTTCHVGPPAEPWIGADYGIFQSDAQCPANSTLAPGGQCICKSGFVEEGNKCVESKCTAGAIKTVNFTIAWSRSGSKNVTPDADIVGKVTMPGTSYKEACIAGCIATIGIDAGMAMYVSNTPSEQGLYRMSQDALVVGTNKACTPGTSDADLAVKADTPPKACPGFVGQVNNKTVCVGTTGSQLPPPSGDLSQASRALTNTGDTGNPKAGERPSTGEGSGNGGVGRTPAEGTGTAAGGPIAAAAGGTGSSTSSGSVAKGAEGTEQQNCGAPGQPKCKIDETGTPSEVSDEKYTSALDKAKGEADAARATISGTTDKGMFESMRTILTSAPPVVACVPMDLPREMGSINPCPVVDGVRYVMAFLWAIGGFWLCVRMVKESV